MDARDILITGASSGLGKCIVQALVRKEVSRNLTIHNLDMNDSLEDKSIGDANNGTRVLIKTYKTDFNCPVSVKASVREVTDNYVIDTVINCVGINRIDWLKDVKTEDFHELMNVNVLSMMLTVQGCLKDLISQKGVVLNIVSNASHMPMTNSFVYNATKGAAHIATLQLARELSRQHGITVFGISPNKLAGTGMSEYIDNRVPEIRDWTPEQAKQYQLNGLLAGEETNPAQLAEFIAFLLSEKQRHKYLTGCVIPYGA